MRGLLQSSADHTMPGNLTEVLVPRSFAVQWPILFAESVVWLGVSLPRWHSQRVSITEAHLYNVKGSSGLAGMNLDLVSIGHVP